MEPVRPAIRSMCRGMLALFANRWKTGGIVDEVTASVEYKDDWFVRAEASIIESRQ